MCCAQATGRSYCHARNIDATQAVTWLRSWLDRLSKVRWTEKETVTTLQSNQSLEFGPLFAVHLSGKDRWHFLFNL